MGVSLVEIACNWRNISQLRSSKLSALPTFDALKTGQPICEAATSVFVGLPTRLDIEVTDIRDWVRDNTRSKFRLYNRFQYEDHAIRVEKTYMGVNFRFEDAHDACLFKLFWW